MKEENKQKIFLEFLKGKNSKEVERLLIARIEITGEVEEARINMSQEELKKVQDNLKQKRETIVLYVSEKQATDEEIKKMYYPKYR